MTNIVIPCFRESRRLPLFLPDLCAVADECGGVTLQVVDDGSGSAEALATEELVTSLRPKHPCLRPLLSLPTNLGKGGAVYAGWDSASAETEWLGFVDADGSVPAREVIRIIQLGTSPPPSPGPFAYFGSRLKILGRNVNRTWKRHLMGRIYATLVSELLGIPIYDSQCGLKLVPATAYRSIRDRLTIHGFAFDVDLLLRLRNMDVQVLEVPIDWQEIPGGKVRLFRDSWRMARDVWRLRKYTEHPVSRP